MKKFSAHFGSESSEGVPLSNKLYVKTKNTKTKGRPKGVMPIDAHVGRVIRARRNFIKISQGELAKNIGLTFQQIQKYEYGTNRISSTRLYQIATVLGVSVDYFFQNIYPEVGSILAEESPLATQNGRTSRKRTGETLDMVRFFTRIENSEIRNMVIHLCKTLSKQEGGQNKKIVTQG